MKPILVVCLNPTLQRTLLFSSWSPGEVNRARSSCLDASGKGINVARIINQYEDSDAFSLHLTHCRGEEGELFEKLCRQEDIEIETVEGGGVRTCTTIVDESKGSATEFIEPSTPVDASTVVALQKRFSELLVSSSLLVLSGSVASGYPDDLFAGFCRQAAEHGIPVVADFRGSMLLKSLSFHPSVIKINLSEFAATFHLGSRPIGEQEDDRELVNAAWPIMERLEKSGSPVVISRGARETLFLKEGKRTMVPARRVEALNTIGCGDAFTAGLALSLLVGESLASGVALGHELASRNAELLRPGSILP
jgi:1-phosphofructokinase/tagatose 6-phosphate kinase